MQKISVLWYIFDILQTKKLNGNAHGGQSLSENEPMFYKILFSRWLKIYKMYREGYNDLKAISDDFCLSCAWGWFCQIDTVFIIIDLSKNCTDLSLIE